VFSFSELLSHPDFLLKDHINETANTIEKITSSKILPSEVKELAKIIGYCHDFGKATSFFQEYIRKTDNLSKDIKLKNHSKISAAFTYHAIRENLDLGASLYPIIGWYVVLKHHGNLKNLSPDKIEEYWIEGKNDQIIRKQAEDIKENPDKIVDIYGDFEYRFKIKNFLDEISSSGNELYESIKRDAFDLDLKIEELDYYVNTLLLYSILQESDKFSAADVSYPERNKVPSYDIVDKYIEEIIQPEDNEINRLRSEASEEIISCIKKVDISRERIFSITLPTGLGKTLSAFKSALKLREIIKDEKGVGPRLIYSLPFLSIIEQNYDTIEEVLEYDLDEIPPDILLKHHYLSKGYRRKDDEENPIGDLLLTESWHSEIVITTFVQLFESMITNKKNRARKFHNITNSIIILDEIQSIPRKYWKLINNFLQKLAEKYECWIIFMTATQPLIFQRKEMTELVDNKEKYFSAMDRIEYEDQRKIDNIDELKTKMLETSRESNNDIMAVMNTIGSAEDLFDRIKNDLTDQEDLIFLSTNLLPQDRLKKINKIKESDNQKFIVTTQLIEAGVDIDVDEIYRDFAPFDSIVQAAGRCNRENKGDEGKVQIMKLRDEDVDTEYSNYIYDGVLLNSTSEGIDELDSFSEKDFNLKGVNQYYHKLKSRGSDKESDEILNYIKNLNFSKAREFRLIKKEYEEVSIYVEKNDEAVRTRKDIERIFDSSWGYERKAKMLKKRNDFYKNIIDLRVSEDLKEKIVSLPKIEGIEDVHLVSKKQKERWYDEDTGFKLPNSTFEDRLV